MEETLGLGSRGLSVMLAQSLLKKAGYDPGPVDGVYGPRTVQAVRQYQYDNGLVPDGITGPATWNALNAILRGYAYHTVRPGDTYYAIARAFYTTPAAVAAANPGVDPNALRIGQTLAVPFGADVTFTDVPYTSALLYSNIQALKVRYPFLETGSIGRSVMGKEIPYIRLGTGPNRVSYNGSHHANEYITTSLLMRFIENCLRACVNGQSLQGYDIAGLWQRSSMYIVPMVNPDGVDLVLGAIPATDPYYRNALRINQTGRPLASVWNANIRGVDLNLNYPANWEAEKELELSYGITGPEPQGFGGTAPLSEPETAAMAEFTRQNDFRLVIAYHTQGEFIFWDFMGLAPPEALPIARRFSAITGYTLSTNPDYASWAGYKDWFIQDFGRPGYTFEVGRGVNPIGLEQLPAIYRQNEGALLLAATV